MTENTTRNEWHEVEEPERTYTYADGQEITLCNVRELMVTDTGHRLTLSDGTCVYVPYGWRVMSFTGGWQV